MNCASCARWITARTTVYGDSSTVETFKASAGKGQCEQLGVETAADFGCNAFQKITEDVPAVPIGDASYESVDPHVIINRKAGAPWTYWVMGPCPDCSNKGNANDGACHRCAGTGQVRYYEDGHVGEERTRLHPKEREQAAKPKCSACGREVERDWNACPTCGQKLDAAVAVENVTDPLFSTAKS